MRISDWSSDVCSSDLQIALHAFARDIRAAGVLAALADLVDLVDEDDAVFFGVADRLGADRLFIDELGGLFVVALPEGVLELHLARTRLVLAVIRELPLPTLRTPFTAARAHPLH